MKENDESTNRNSSWTEFCRDPELALELEEKRWKEWCHQQEEDSGRKESIMKVKTAIKVGCVNGRLCKRMF